MVNHFKGCKDGSILFNLCYSDETSVPHILFNNIECIFKNLEYIVIFFFADGKNKDMIKNYGKIIMQVENEIYEI